MMQKQTIPFYSLLLVAVILMSCKNQEKFSGFSYDPTGSTVTTDKNIETQHKRTIGIQKDGIWVSNEFAGARMNDFYKVNDSLYQVTIKPENFPINDSPWYAFKIWSDSVRNINLTLTYQHGSHRYIPKLSHDGDNWETISSHNYQPDTLESTANLSLQISRDTLWVSAQELLTQADYFQWADSLQQLPFVSIDTAGYSHKHRPVIKLSINETPKNKPHGVLIITGRLHPPEVTGAMACETFINTLTSDTKLASRFRKHFEIWAYPLINSDGVQQGNWRGNAAGVDLNRDWIAFNQPETQAVRDDLLKLKNDRLQRVYYGIDFHSTDENIFYPINRDINTFPDDFTYRWLDELRKAFPQYPFRVEPFDTSSPITKNWIHRTFGADAVTYEVNDTVNRDSMRTVTKESARLIMQQLLEKM